jgi:hypothetical protein
MAETPTLQWFAKTKDLLKMGPYDSQARAWEAVLDFNTGTPVDGAIVWCEEKSEEAHLVTVQWGHLTLTLVNSGEKEWKLGKLTLKKDNCPQNPYLALITPNPVDETFTGRGDSPQKAIKNLRENMGLRVTVFANLVETLLENDP